MKLDSVVLNQYPGIKFRTVTIKKSNAKADQF